MKKFSAVVVSALLVGSMSFAADAENTESQTVDKSKNILTGTETTTVKSKKKVKTPHGKVDAKVTETTEVHKNGKVEKEVEVKGDSSTETK